MENNGYMQQNQNQNLNQNQLDSFREPSTQNMNSVATPTVETEPFATPPEPKSKRPIIIAVILACIVLLVVIVICVILFLPKGDFRDDGSETNEPTTSESDDSYSSSSSSKEKLKKLGFIRSYDWKNLHDFTGFDGITYDGMKLPLTGEKILERYKPDEFEFVIKKSGSSRTYSESSNTIDALNNYESVSRVELYQNGNKVALQKLSFGQTSTLSDFQNGNFLILGSFGEGDSIKYFGISADEYSRLDNHTISDETGYYDEAIDLHLILQKFGKPTGIIMDTSTPNVFPALYWMSNDYMIAIWYDDIVIVDGDGYTGLMISDFRVGPKNIILEGIQRNCEYISLDDFLEQYPNPSRI